ncbi:MAG: (5-formylfuran-3-yl)methyl phosphate synthase [Planctomycetaceae bacterium]
MPPGLLVSVRSSAEATAALRGGADIIDVKEPALGSLGRAPGTTISDIVDVVRASDPTIPVSAALGELREWSTANGEASDDPPVFDASQTDSLRGLSYVKMGLSGTAPPAPENERIEDWRIAVRRVRQSLLATLPDNHAALSSNVPAIPAWVAVAYADHQRAAAPSIFDVLQDAVANRHPVLLVDTFTKDETTLLDWLTVAQLSSLKSECRAAGLRLALAGRLSLSLIRELRNVAPDIIAVRGAACSNSDRNAEISADRVREVRHAIAAEHWPTSVPQHTAIGN